MGTDPGITTELLEAFKTRVLIDTLGSDLFNIAVEFCDYYCVTRQEFWNTARKYADEELEGTYRELFKSTAFITANSEGLMPCFLAEPPVDDELAVF